MNSSVQSLALHSRDRFLENALLFTFFAHAAGMLCLPIFLARGVPGGINPDIIMRMAYIANHPWLWRMGWLPWQITALSDFVLSFALICTPWISRRISLLALAATICAIIPEQLGQSSWMWIGPTLARGEAQTYLQYESHTFRAVAGIAPCFYTIAAIGWSFCFARAGVWSKTLTKISVACWGLFAIATIFVFFPDLTARSLALRLVISAGNAIAFLLLLIWLLLVNWQMRRRRREPI